MPALLAAFAVLGLWIVLLAARGGFWRAAEREDRDLPPAPAAWPEVVAVVPARDEAETVGRAVGSLLAQDYPGRLRVVLVDDGSSDGTAEIARRAAEAAGAGDRLTVIRGRPLAPGWTGKLYALRQGVEAATRGAAPPWLLFTDADIAHDPGSVARLVRRGEAGDRVLVSIMVKLNCESRAERAFIPAFVFFFQMLYPFAWVNRPDRRTAAAAGGAALVRREALERAGGLEAIRGALIDDCALAARLKREGPIRLDLSERVRSLRAYRGVGPIRRMVVRSAYDELRRSPPRLLAAVAGMALVFLAPPLLALLAGGAAALMGLAAWALMALAFRPTLRLYGLSPLWGLALPAIAAVYTLWTLDSALEHARGRGGVWKGRRQAAPGGAA